MSGASSIQEVLRETTSKLRQPLSDSSELVQLLDLPRELLGLTTQKNGFASMSQHGLRLSARETRLISSLQEVLLSVIIPTWEALLNDEGRVGVIEDFFCPPQTTVASCRQVALSAYLVLLSNPISNFTLRILPSLIATYPIDTLHSHIFLHDSKDGIAAWEELVRVCAALPAKVANSTDPSQVPETLRLR